MADIRLLKPELQIMYASFSEECEKKELDFIVTSTFRSCQEQNLLFSLGRGTQRGRIVTKAIAGYSWHNFGQAFDIVPIRFTKPVWGTTGKDLVLWRKFGIIGESVGLEWAGRWEKFTEFPHFMARLGKTLKELREEKCY